MRKKIQGIKRKKAKKFKIVLTGLTIDSDYKDGGMKPVSLRPGDLAFQFIGPITFPLKEKNYQGQAGFARRIFMCGKIEVIQDKPGWLELLYLSFLRQPACGDRTCHICSDPRSVFP